jgi:hypothetical protein
MTEPPTASLAPAELPLVLLAAVAHPDESYRLDLGARLRSAIERRDPLYTPRTLRSFFRRQDRRHRMGLRINPALRELAVLAARVAFSGAFSEGPSALLVSPGDAGLKAGYLVKRSLDVVSLDRCTLTRHRLRRRKAECAALAHFMPELARSRLAGFRRGESSVRAVCRVAGRLELELTDEISWPSGVDLMGTTSRMPRARPELLGFCQRWQGKALLLWPETPEATLRFTAWLTEGRQLVLEQAQARRRDRRTIVVRLRDFDGDCAVLPVKASGPAEPWLVRFPGLDMALSGDDWLALARWAYPLDTWMTTDLVEKLI